MGRKKKRTDPRERAKRRRLARYKMKIGHLAYRHFKGDSLATKVLAKELVENSYAKEVLKSVFNSKRWPEYYDPARKLKIKTYNIKPSKNTRFFQGGAPSLGKKR